LAIECRWAEGHYDRLSDLAIDLVHSGVEVIATSGGDTVAGAAKGATGAIPIVFTSRWRCSAIPRWLGRTAIPNSRER
jgi:putative ABC transport system substrate-binding protein